MKRITAVICIFLLVLSVTGCVNTPESKTEQPATTSPQKTEDTKAEEAPKTDFPTKNIKIIVPFAPGGGTDITARVFAEAAGKDFFNGHSLVVENMGGGGAVIGQTYVANTAKPDGYTVMLFTSSAINNTLLKEVTYSYKDFKPIAMVCPDAEIITVPTDSPYKTLSEFIEYAKTNTVKVSTPGHSSGHHIRAMNIANKMGLKFEYLHNDSAAIQLQQLMGGHCDAAFMTVGEASGAINDGNIIGLGVMNKERVDSIPDVPTFAEEGYEGWIDGASRGFAVHKDVPEDVYKILVDEFKKIAETDKFKDGMKKVGMNPGYDTPEEYQKYIDNTAAAITELKPVLLGK